MSHPESKKENSINTYCKLIRETSKRLRRELPSELWWLSGVELAITFSIGRKNDLLVLRLLGESSKQISESFSRDKDSSRSGDAIIMVGMVGVDVTAKLFIICGRAPLFNLNMDKNVVNNPTKNIFNKVHLFMMRRAYFFCTKKKNLI